MRLDMKGDYSALIMKSHLINLSITIKEDDINLDCYSSLNGLIYNNLTESKFSA